MATFRCKRSGNTVSFTNVDDIKAMRVHESYTEVKEPAVAAPPPPPVEPARKPRTLSIRDIPKL